ncbi:MAG: hypothetical protein IH960_09845 [Chloroflexi bacterium]|nr:hypothetical protein [Chloroflexota bacterium]
MDTTKTDGLAVSLWESLRSYLVVTESDSGETVTITNNSPSSLLRPKVVFKDIVVKITGGAKPDSSSTSRLQPGEAFEVQLQNPLQTDSLIDVTASVDLDEYSKISVVSQGTVKRMRELAAEWFRKFDEFDIHGQLAQLIGSIPEVSENSTIAEMKRLEILPETMTAIFNDFNESVGRHYPIERHISPHESVMDTARAIGRPISQIATAAGNGDTDAIKTHVIELLDLPDPALEFDRRRSLMLEVLEDPQ